MYKKTRTLSIPVSPEVAAFAVVMEARLALEGYDEVEKWEGMPTTKLMNQLEIKAKRLAAADPTNATELFNKAVIIGNLAMMIAEKAARAKEQTMGSELHTSPIVPCTSGTTHAVALTLDSTATNGDESPQQSNGKLPQGTTSPRHIRQAAFRRQAGP